MRPAAEKDSQKNPAKYHSQTSRQLKDSRNQQAIFARVRVVVVTEKQDLVYWRPNLP